MRVLGLILVLISAFFVAQAQVCTLTLGGNWTNPGPTCQEGGTPTGKSVLVIPAGLTVTFNGNTDTWSGLRIDVYGTLTISANITINSSIVVKSGGLLNINGRLNIGSAPNCGHTLIIENGGRADLTSNGSSDRLFICTNLVIRGGSGGNCEPYPGLTPPYCEPGSGGFVGPTGFDEDGYDSELPVTWLSFTTRNIDNKSVFLSWSTATEVNAESFIIERSANGKDYFPVGTQPASGNSSVRRDYSFTDSHPFTGRTYYRLRQLDFDGSAAYSDIRFVDLSGRRSVSVFPNPLEKDELNVQLNFSDEDEVFVSVYDISGLRIDQFSFFGAVFAKQLKLNAGTYLLKAKSGTEDFFCRFVVR